MSDTVKTFDELVAALPQASGNPVVVANGQAGVESSSNFVRKTGISLVHEKVLRMTNFESIIISSRSTNAQRTCFVWVSSYGVGQQLRTNACILYSNPKFKWFINGPSENLALYIKNENPTSSDYFSATALTGMLPNLQIVDSVPSDATPLQNDLIIPVGGGKTLPFNQLQFFAERRVA